MKALGLGAALALFCAAFAGLQATGGAQTPTCFGRPATHVVQPGVPLVGTSGSDVIVGTPGADVIRGKGGGDYICSLAGPDLVYGNGGDDHIKAGAGADTVHGGKGNDAIVGNSGQDTLNGNSGRDEIEGKKGSDTINGGTGPDSLWGNGGPDDIAGGRGGDDLHGGSKADRLRGNSGNDLLRGGSAVDDCAGGSGISDRLFSCNDRDPFVGKRSGIDVDGTFQTINVVSTGPGTYNVVLTDTGNGGCGRDAQGNPLHGAISRGTAVSQGNALIYDYIRSCQGGSRPDLNVTGRRFNLMADASLVNDIDGAVFG